MSPLADLIFCFIVLMWVGYWLRFSFKANWVRYTGLDRFPIVMAVYVLVGHFVMVFLAQYVFVTLIPLPGAIAGKDLSYDINIMQLPLAFICLLAVRIIPLEVLFRGFVQRSLMAHWGARTGIVTSALFYTSMMIGCCSTYYLIAIRLIQGLYLGWLYLRLRSLWPCIIAQMLFALL